MLKNYKMVKKLENRISELEEKIPDEYDIRSIAGKVIDAEKAELREIYKVRRDAMEEAWHTITDNIEGVMERRLPVLIEEATKDIQDKLIVELARKAMNMENTK